MNEYTGNHPKANKFDSEEKDDEFLEIFYRGFGFSLASLIALLSGYFINRGAVNFVNLDMSNLLLILTFYFLSLPFFIVYVYKYPTQREKSSKSLLVVYIIISILGALVFILLSLMLKADYSIMPYIVPLLVYTLLFNTSAFHLHREKDKTKLNLVRNRLIWPVIISIAISLYFGINLNNLAVDYGYYIPILLLIMLFYISKNKVINEKLFGIINLGVLFVALVLVIISQLSDSFEMPEYMTSIVFCIITVAYIAVFESWKITSELLKKEDNDAESDNSLKVTKNQEYSRSTSIAFLVSIIIFTFMYVYARIGLVFLLGFILHFIITTFFWFFIYKGCKIRKMWGMKGIPTTLGYVILSLLAIDSIFYFPATIHLPNNIISLSGIGVLLAFYALIISLSEEFKGISKKQANSIAKKFKIFFIGNYFRILVPLSIIMILLLSLFKEFGTNVNQLNRYDYAIYIYIGIASICIIYEIFHNYDDNSHEIYFDTHDQKPTMEKEINNLEINSNNMVLHKKLSIRMIGFLQTTRLPVSFTIGLIVFLPLYLSENNFFISILKAIPFMFASMGGFALNDYFDFNRDAINKPFRAIPSGKLTRNHVKKISLLLLFIALMISYFFSDTLTEFVFYISAIFGVILYNLIVNKISLIKTLSAAIISSIPLFYIIVILNYHPTYLLLGLSTCIFLLGRELLMDVLDIKGDTLSGISTIVKFINKKYVVFSAFTLQFIALILLLPVVLLVNSYFLFSTYCIICLFTSLLCFIWSKNKRNYQLFVIRLLWVPMIFGILLLIQPKF